MIERTPIEPSNVTWTHAIYFWSIYFSRVAPQYIRKTVQNVGDKIKMKRHGLGANEDQIQYFTARYRQDFWKMQSQPTRSPADFLASKKEMRRMHRELQATGFEITRNAARNSLSRLLRRR